MGCAKLYPPKCVGLTSSFYFLALKQVPLTIPLSVRQPFTASEIIAVTLYALVLIAGTIGNGILIFSFITKRDQPGMRFVIILAAVDMLSSIWVPLNFISKIVWKFKDSIGEMQHCPFGNIGCNITKVWYVCMLYVSAWLLVAICVERVR